MDDNYIYHPPGFAIHSLVRGLDPDYMDEPEYRRAVTRDNPLLFAFVYMPDWLRSSETKNRFSLNQLHIDMAQNALRWRNPLGNREHRRAWSAPRHSGKSTWDFGILPMWALAHGHRHFPALFSDAGGQAFEHFRSLKKELETNPRLITDYPDLCAPALRRGNRSDTDNSTEFHSKGGHTIIAKGIDARTLGLKSGTMRPDLLCLDDVEPPGARYGLGAKEKRLRTILDAILPMNLNAAVEMVGTTVMYDSIIHDVVRSATGGKVAEWIEEENFKCRYYPALYRDEKGVERSLWPVRWDADELGAMRRTRTFALNMQNQPLSTSSGFWDRDDFRYDAHFQSSHKVLVIDPATTSKETSDYTGIALLASDPAQRRVMVEWARGVKLRPDKLRELVHWFIRTHPDITTVIIEVNQGGDFVKVRILPLPRSVQVLTPHEHAPKIQRIADLHDYYTREWVFHAPGLTALEEQQIAYPNVENDDIVDAVAKGVHHFLSARRATAAR